MEKEYQISWLKVIGIVGLLVVVIALIWWLIPNKSHADMLASNTYINNINAMKEAGFDYFKGSNLPEKIGETNEITLQDMIDSNLIIEFYDENGKTCNTDRSYIKVTKNLDNEYAMKVALECENKKDYIITTIEDNKTTIVHVDDSSNNVNNSNNTNNNKPNTSTNTVNQVSNNKNNSTSTNNNKIIYINNCKDNDCLNNVYYSVYFDSDGGNYIPKKTIKAGERVNSVYAYKDGYKFLGWYKNGVLFDFSTPINETTTLVAKWEKQSNSNTNNQKEYVVNFVTNGGSTIDSVKVIENNRLVKPNNPTLNCYDFVGWYTDKALTNRYDFNRPVTSNLTLYAKWVSNDTCTTYRKVTYVYNNGSDNYTINVKNGEYLSIPNNPTLNCYDFVGWYTNSSYSNRYNFNKPVTSDLTLYAKWLYNDACTLRHNITFIYNNGTSARTVTVKDGEYLDVPSNPTRSGYDFAGWYSNNKRFNFSKRIYQDYVIEAEWDKAEEKYHTYCRNVSDRYYSTSYVSANMNTWSYDWTIRFDKIFNARDVKITNIGYLNNLSMYNNSYNASVNGKGISKVNGNSKYSVPITSGTMLRTYSLKSDNFDKYLSNPYYSNGYWYTDASVRIRNYYNLNKYYASNINSEIYFVPFYFDVNYTDMGNCVNDLASRSGSYRDYTIVDTFYR
ncbi:MAG: InlB B-repeat-containing protein [Ruminococcus sp.]|nr:InlB B-repeat-containing protein [Ruminococcus sp.]